MQILLLLINRNHMALIPIMNGLPTEVSSQLMASEKVYYFTFITFKGGCGSSGMTENYWLALTDRRVMYKTKVSDIKGKQIELVENDGDLPFDKISFIEISQAGTAQGCSTNKMYHLRISTSGGTVIIPIPTKEKGTEIRRIYTELSNQTS
jgi:hypothetical protein